MPAPPTRRNISSFFGRSSNVATTSVGRSIERIGRGTSTTKIVPQAPGAPGYDGDALLQVWDGTTLTKSPTGGISDWMPEGAGSGSIWVAAWTLRVEGTAGDAFTGQINTLVGSSTGTVTIPASTVGYCSGAAICVVGPGSGFTVTINRADASNDNYNAELRFTVSRLVLMYP